MSDSTDRAPAGRRLLVDIERYYRYHAKLYDVTRWGFLFGRNRLVEAIAARRRPTNILEIGCGTGKNLLSLCRQFPAATVTGVDISPAMLTRARRKLSPFAERVTLLDQPYAEPLRRPQPFDLIFFSYSLSMINPGWERAIACAQADLAPAGLIAVVDFNDSPVALFKRWMGMNHVKMEGHLLPKLQAHFQGLELSVRLAYGGLWTYLLFLGEQA